MFTSMRRVAARSAGRGSITKPILSVRFQSSFDKADVNTDQKLSVDEFKGYVAGTGLTWEDPLLKMCFAQLDKDKDGFISVAEWEKLLGPQGWKALRDLRAKVKKEDSSDCFAKLSAAFAESDTDSSGDMTKDEFTALLKAKGLCTSDDRVSTIFKQLDKDSSGTISPDEWMELLGPQGFQALTLLRKKILQAE
eukprot:TRINITY_DN99698_c0_g1_i1.p1 TRINITY_DN99698_c0_g1~~TRINITY_DN99698_c0_g1_i1.p1  ORF type:complete len:194 (-),score=37.97 TRINITY_DN99698_c0_g1_i1:40-621(-)